MRWVRLMALVWAILGSPRIAETEDLYELLTLGPVPGFDLSGRAMAGAGDVNADGLADLIVGNIVDHECWVFFGRVELDTTPDIIIPCPETNPDDVFNGYGAYVSGGTDINGDGFDDISVLNHEWNYTTGKIYIYFGGDPMDLYPDIGLASWGSSWMTLFWTTGIDVRFIRDLNGDQYDDLVLLVDNGIDDGAYVYYGGAPMDSVHDLAFRGVFPEPRMGEDAADGDINGNGGVDVAVSSHQGDGLGDIDAAYLYSGGAMLDTIPDLKLRVPDDGCDYDICIPGDCNGDGYDDVVLVTPSCFTFRLYWGGPEMDDEADLVFAGGLEDGWLRLTGGDLNSDGFADLIVSETDRYNPEFGWLLGVFFGGTEMDNCLDIEVRCESDKRSTILAWIGDMTGDGHPEFAVTHPTRANEIYIYTMGEVSGDGPNPNALHVGKLRIVPNPSNGMTMIRFDVDEGAEDEVRIYDLAGHLIRRLEPFLQEVEPHWVLWDGRSSSGDALPGGTYVVRVQSGNEAFAKRIVVAR